MDEEQGRTVAAAGATSGDNGLEKKDLKEALQKYCQKVDHDNLRVQL